VSEKRLELQISEKGCPVVLAMSQMASNDQFLLKILDRHLMS
jgi:hypothetical protein